ncbi:HDOD domain-containing protein [bacterium]|nr:HDOD domain-containing protein [bacterium]
MRTTQKIDFSKLRDVPPLPIVVTRAIQVINDPDSSAKELTDLIIHDQVLAAKILKVANSAYYGLPSKISNLNRAITLIGFDEVKRMIAPILLFNTFKNFQNNEYFSSRDFWIHSLAVADACEILVEKINQPQDAGEARVVGLLHDVGRLVLVGVLQFHFNKVMKKVSMGVDVLKAEEGILGMDHARIGAKITESWNLPESVVNIIKYHHDPENAGKHSNLAEVVCMADYLANELNIKSLVIGETHDVPDYIRDRFIHEEDDLDIILAKLESEVEKAKTLVAILND